jgi:hypothetical protein
MKIVGAVLAMALLAAGPAVAAEQTWTGVISDSNCGAVHRSDKEHGGNITARECIIGQEGNPNIPGCVSEKNKRSFVFVVNGKVYNISNQDHAGLRTHAAHTVNLKGELAGDTIKVASIAMPAKSN